MSIGETTQNIQGRAFVMMYQSKTGIILIIMLMTLFKDFFTKLDATVDRHAPLKKLTPREIKMENKPWLRAEIIKLIILRNKVFARKKANLLRNANVYLTPRIPHSLLLYPSTPNEISDIISLLDDSKSSGPSTISIKILKIANNHISCTFSDNVTFLSMKVFFLT